MVSEMESLRADALSTAFAFNPFLAMSKESSNSLNCRSFSATAITICQLVVYQPDQFTHGFDHCMLPFLY